MNQKPPRRGSNVSVGGSVIGSAIGNDNTVSGNEIEITATNANARPGIEELRAAIAALRTELDRADTDEKVISEAEYELTKIEESLESDQPDAEAVQVRWKHVRKLLGPLQYTANLAQITDLVLTVFKS